MKKKLIVGISLFLLTAASQLRDADQIRRLFGLDAYPVNHRLAQLKIAVLDNGFAGAASGGYLPASAKIVENYDEAFVTKFNLGDPKYQPQFDGSDHGRIMAQLVWEMTGRQAGGPQFFLLNASGITGFRRAVRYAIEEKVDIILYSQNRECCGHFDGGGFYNAIVNQATQAGILWVNAAGNYGGRVYNSRLNTAGHTLRIKSHLDENTVQVILNWNSQGAEEETGTDKDLDLFIYDSNNQVVAKSELKQVWKKEKLEDTETYLPRERIRTQLQQGDYRIVVQAKSQNFNHNDRIRVVVIPEREPVQGQNGNDGPVDAVQLLDRTEGQEIMVPGDNPNVLTVGDTNSYSAQGPTMDGRLKPEIVLEKSDTNFTDGRGSAGTSNAAALFAGIAAVMKAERPDLSHAMIVRYVQRLVQRLPAPPPAQLPMWNVSFHEVLGMHRPLMIAIEDAVNEGPVLTGRFQDGHYAVGYASSPEEITGRICGAQLLEKPTTDAQYFLGFGQAPKLPPGCARAQAQRIICCARNPEMPYPWQVFQVSTREFLEVRGARPVEEGGGTPVPPSSSARIWRTPSPQELMGL